MAAINVDLRCQIMRDPLWMEGNDLDDDADDLDEMDEDDEDYDPDMLHDGFFDED